MNLVRILFNLLTGLYILSNISLILLFCSIWNVPVNPRNIGNSGVISFKTISNGKANILPNSLLNIECISSQIINPTLDKYFLNSGLSIFFNM